MFCELRGRMAVSYQTVQPALIPASAGSKPLTFPASILMDYRRTSFMG